jgi:hypothetical protein
MTFVFLMVLISAMIAAAVSSPVPVVDDDAARDEPGEQRNQQDRSPSHELVSLQAWPVWHFSGKKNASLANLGMQRTNADDVSAFACLSGIDSIGLRPRHLES